MKRVRQAFPFSFTPLTGTGFLPTHLPFYLSESFLRVIPLEIRFLLRAHGGGLESVGGLL
jgi:hypothetical protein